MERVAYLWNHVLQLCSCAASTSTASMRRDKNIALPGISRGRLLDAYSCGVCSAVPRASDSSGAIAAEGLLAEPPAAWQMPELSALSHLRMPARAVK